MRKLSKSRKVYRVSMIAGISAMLMIPVIFIFVLLPIYGLVGSGLDATIADNKLDSLQKLSTIFNVILVVLLIVSLLFAAIGLYKDAQAKSKTKS